MASTGEAVEVSSSGGAVDATSGDEPLPDAEGTGSDSGSDSTAEHDTGADACRPIEIARVEHDAFHGHGCYDLPPSAVLRTQAEVDAHALAMCDVHACWAPGVCDEPPVLASETMIVFVSVATNSSPAHVEIVSADDCDGTIVVSAISTSGPDAALDWGWDSVVMAATDDPIEVVVTSRP